MASRSCQGAKGQERRHCCRPVPDPWVADKNVGAPGQLANGFDYCRARSLMQTPLGKLTSGRSSKVLGGAI